MVLRAMWLPTRPRPSQGQLPRACSPRLGTLRAVRKPRAGTLALMPVGHPLLAKGLVRPGPPSS